MPWRWDVEVVDRVVDGRRGRGLADVGVIDLVPGSQDRAVSGTNVHVPASASSPIVVRAAGDHRTAVTKDLAPVLLRRRDTGNDVESLSD